MSLRYTCHKCNEVFESEEPPIRTAGWPLCRKCYANAPEPPAREIDCKVCAPDGILSSKRCPACIKLFRTEQDTLINSITAKSGTPLHDACMEEIDKGIKHLKDLESLTIPEAAAALVAEEKIQALEWPPEKFVYLFRYSLLNQDNKAIDAATLFLYSEWRIYAPPEPPVEFGWHDDLEKFPVPGMAPGVASICVAYKSGLHMTSNGPTERKGVDVPVAWTYCPNYKPNPEDEG